jgi:hypothetical protein
MDKTIITIDQIKENLNLDLSERINAYLSNSNFDFDDAKYLALATIKQEYEFWSNNRTVVSKRTDELLQKILNGHTLNNIESFEMICDDEKKVEEYSKFEILKNNIQKSNGISLDDFMELCSIIGFDTQTTYIIKSLFETQGLIIEQYNQDDQIKL